MFPVLVLTSSFCYSGSISQGLAVGMNTYEVTKQECTHRASSLIGRAPVEFFPMHIAIENPLSQACVKTYISKKKFYNGVCRYDKWWLTSHLRASRPEHFISHFESTKGATHTYLPIDPSSFGVSWLQEPPIHAPYKKVRVSSGYWRHSERYFSLISSILALLSGLLINSVT